MKYETNSIFPHFEFIQDGDDWVYVTKIRKLDEQADRMYVATMWERGNPKLIFPGALPITKEILLQKAVFSAYKLLLFGNINSSLFIPDTDQQHERDRFYLRIKELEE